jgi:hypothetical protein
MTTRLEYVVSLGEKIKEAPIDKALLVSNYCPSDFVPCIRIPDAFCEDCEVCWAVNMNQYQLDNPNTCYPSHPVSRRKGYGGGNEVR